MYMVPSWACEVTVILTKWASWVLCFSAVDEAPAYVTRHLGPELS